jgi:hypothetical protein
MISLGMSNIPSPEVDPAVTGTAKSALLKKTLKSSANAIRKSA